MATTSSTSRPSSNSALPAFTLGPAQVVWTGRGQGHLGRLRPGEDTMSAIADRRRAVTGLPWHTVQQVHGANVVTVTDASAPREATEADALVTAQRGMALVVFTADCAPVAFSSSEGVIGLAHVGWRGLVAGVIPATADAMRALGAVRIDAALGPCIRAGCYEFGAAKLDRLAELFGPTVRATTGCGKPALDLVRAVEVSLERSGVALAVDSGACTACSARWYSHRARGDDARQATLVWLP